MSNLKQRSAGFASANAATISARYFARIGSSLAARDSSDGRAKDGTWFFMRAAVSVVLASGAIIAGEWLNEMQNTAARSMAHIATRATGIHPDLAAVFMLIDLPEPHELHGPVIA
jgi:hypothetical protein